MAPSQLKKLKASVQAQRNSKKRPVVSTTSASNANDRSQRVRSQTLLPELQKRHKVGGIVDRRIGENDPRLAPGDRMLQRFAAESQKSKRESIFNLEDGEDDDLTHGGQPLRLQHEGSATEDFKDEETPSDDHNDEVLGHLRKRPRQEDAIDSNITEMEPQRKKSKKEIMDEVIAKSKSHKYERQRAKEEDEDAREELDRGMADLLAALQSSRSQGGSLGTSPLDKNGMSNDVSVANKEKEYDQRVRQMQQDKKAQPSERTRTEEEKANAQAQHLHDLERQRLRRMRGEEEEQNDKHDDVHESEDSPDRDYNEASTFGFVKSIPDEINLDAEDEHDFLIDDDLVESDSDVDIVISDDDSLVAPSDRMDDDEEFLHGVVHEPSSKNQTAGQLAYTYSCPQSIKEFQQILSDVPVSEIATVVQRIRALYHAELHSDNKQKMSVFAAVLVEYLSIWEGGSSVPLHILETLIRHIHSLSRIHGDAVARAFRSCLQQIHNDPVMSPGHLVILTAIKSIYPTSDHFHQIVTPAITIMARWLALATPHSQSDAVKGAFVVALVAKYCSFANRYVPEALRYTLAVLRSPNQIDSPTAHVKNLRSMVEMWSSKTAFIEIFEDVLPLLEGTSFQQDGRRVRIMMEQAQSQRRALELHHHRPLPIKTAFPKFEENFNPDKHYDPDKERTEAKKLQKEFKRERKGALRELKKDAEFIGREKLREKKARDASYEAKQKRLIAEINAEEGQGRNEYEREKRKRKGRR